MKFHNLLSIIALVLAALLCSSAVIAQIPDDRVVASEQTSLGSAFNFQGALRNGNEDVNGSCDFKFSLYSALSGGTQIGNDLFRTNIAVAGGRFATSLDFGNVFTGDPRWIATAVRCPSGNGTYTVLSPRQEIMAAPYAMTSARISNLGTQGDLIVKGLLRSSRGDPGGNAGILQLANTLTGSQWQFHVGSENDKLYLGFFNSQNVWSHVATIDRNDGLLVNGNLYVAGKYTSDMVTTGVLRSSRGLPGDDLNGGIVELESTVTNNKWHIHIPRDDNYLEFVFFENNVPRFPAMTLEDNGNLHITGDSLILANSAKASGLVWNMTETAIGWAHGAGEWSKDSQAGDLVVRPDKNKRLILASGSQYQPAAVTIEPSGIVSITNLQGGGYIEANLQTAAELQMDRIERFSQGDVLCWQERSGQLELCTEQSSPLVTAIADANGKPLILGVEPVKVIGPVKAGDLLVAAVIPGYAIAWSQIENSTPPAGVVIAKALQSVGKTRATIKATILMR